MHAFLHCLSSQNYIAESGVYRREPTFFGHWIKFLLMLFQCCSVDVVWNDSWVQTFHSFKKSNRQINNFARALHFVCAFLCRHRMTTVLLRAWKQDNDFLFLFLELWCSALEFISRKICQNLTNFLERDGIRLSSLGGGEGAVGLGSSYCQRPRPNLNARKKRTLWCYIECKNYSKAFW